MQRMVPIIRVYGITCSVDVDLTKKIQVTVPHLSSMCNKQTTWNTDTLQKICPCSEREFLILLNILVCVKIVPARALSTGRI